MFTLRRNWEISNYVDVIVDVGATSKGEHPLELMSPCSPSSHLENVVTPVDLTEDIRLLGLCKCSNFGNLE